MPERLSFATVATCAVLAGAVFGGAYALAHDGPAAPAPAPASPTAIKLKDDPIGELRRVSPLPALIVPPPRPAPAEPEPVVEDPPAVAPAPAPEVPAPAPAVAPEPAPAPAPKPPAPRKPLTFDDSG
jgi:hypothetical protein